MFHEFRIQDTRTDLAFNLRSQQPEADLWELTVAEPASDGRYIALAEHEGPRSDMLEIMIRSVSDRVTAKHS